MRSKRGFFLRAIGVAVTVGIALGFPLACGGGRTISGTAKTALNIRALPAIGSQHIATLGKGDALKIVAAGPADTIEKMTQAWLLIESAQGSGWVFGGFVEVTAPISDLAKKPFKFSKNKKVYIYDTADANGKKTGILPFGSILDENDLKPVPNGGKPTAWYNWSKVQGFVQADALSDQPRAFRAEKLVFTAKSLGEHDAAAGGDDEVYEFYNGVCTISQKSDGRGYNTRQIRSLVLDGYYLLENGKLICSVKGREKSTYCNGPEGDEKCESSERKIEMRKELLFKTELGGYIRPEDAGYLGSGKIDRRACTVSGTDKMNSTATVRYWCI